MQRSDRQRGAMTGSDGFPPSPSGRASHEVSVTDVPSGSDYLCGSAVAADRPAWIELAALSAALYAREPV
jgi:hypothetical protein